MSVPSWVVMNGMGAVPFSQVPASGTGAGVAMTERTGEYASDERSGLMTTTRP